MLLGEDLRRGYQPSLHLDTFADIDPADNRREARGLGFARKPTVGVGEPYRPSEVELCFFVAPRLLEDRTIFLRDLKLSAVHVVSLLGGPERHVQHERLCLAHLEDQRRPGLRAGIRRRAVLEQFLGEPAPDDIERLRSIRPGFQTSLRVVQQVQERARGLMVLRDHRSDRVELSVGHAAVVASFGRGVLRSLLRELLDKPRCAKM